MSISTQTGQSLKNANQINDNCTYYLFKIFLLLFVGIIFLSLGLYKLFFSNDNYIPFFVPGILLIIPGAYYSYILINILMGREYYDYDLIPDLNG